MTNPLRNYVYVYSLLTLAAIGICFKVKDDYFFIPYPNAIEWVLVLIILSGTFVLAWWPAYRRLKLLLGLASSGLLLLTVSALTYCFEWHPLAHSLPFTPSQSVEVSYEPAPWPTASPVSVGLNTDRLTQYLREVSDWQRLQSLLVIKDDKLVLEHYRGGATKYTAANVHSLTKSITSALIGLAIQKGHIASEQEPMIHFLAAYRTQIGPESPKNAITLANLLAMQGGFTGHDGTENVEQVLSQRRVDRRAISRHFNYYSGAYMLLSAVLTNATRMSTKAFAEQELFKPLGMQNAFWRKVDGYYCGGDQTYFTARDLARFGSLYLHNGKVGSRQVLDSSWVAKSFSCQALPPPNEKTPFCYQERGYGYGWWLLRYQGEDFYAGRGMGGQYLLILPSRQTVVVIQQGWQFKKDLASENRFICKLLSILL